MAPQKTPELQALIDEFQEFLTLERAALLGGDLDVLTSLLPRKEGLISRLSTLADQKDLVNLQGQLNQNQAMLDQAMAGIQAAAQRLATLRAVQAGTSTYDSAGNRLPLEHSGQTTLERRA